MLRPRVTSILSPFTDFSKIDPEVLDMASDRGTRAHAAALAYAFGLWSPEIDEDIAGYVKSYKAWHDRFVFKVLAVEKELIHPRWNYVGHCDLVAWVSGYKPEPVICIPDLKTPITASLTWRCQGAAYREAEQLEHKEHVYAGVLQLRRDGGLPKMTWIEDENQAFAAFIGALSAWNYIKAGK
ncbi:MAG: hypothetical protein WC455_17665 [Dehalococcoidia bacterium]